jgi:uncharacterized membrane protein
MIGYGDLAALLSLYAVTTVLAVCVMPLAAYVRPGQLSAAWALARIGALPLVTWIAWLLSFAMGWSLEALLVGAALVAAASVCAFSLSPRTRRSLRHAPIIWLRAEIIYLLLFLIVVWIRSWQSDLETLEKFMNIAFINAIYHAPSLPAMDPWYAGAPINYYVFGHTTIAAAAHLSGTATDICYNLMFGHVFAAAGLGIAAAVKLLVMRAVRRPHLARLAGMLAAITVILGGNFHSAVYGLGRPALEGLGLTEKGEDYFFAHSSRFIGYHPETDDKTITEFPGYSVAVGDLHAHVINLPIAVGLLLLAVSVPLGRLAGWAAMARQGVRRRQGLAFAAASVALLGFSGMANSWDVPIYLSVFGLSFMAAAHREGAGWLEAFGRSATVCLLMLAASMMVSSVFWLTFQPFTKGIGFVRYGSPLWQLGVLYGNLIAVAAGSIFFITSRATRQTPLRRVLYALIAISASALVVLAVPEIVFVRDLYGDTFQRANTMFKLSYQAYVMLPVAAFAGAAITLSLMKRPEGRWAAGLFSAVLLFSPLYFAVNVHSEKLAKALKEGGHLDGYRFMNEDDLAAVRYLEAHRPYPGEALLEASGESYSYAARMSAATGIPTVLGWNNHEWLWRKEESAWKPRADAISAFYQSMTESERRAFLDSYKVRFVVIGRFERGHYPGLDENALRLLGDVVFEQGETVLVEVRE